MNPDLEQLVKAYDVLARFSQWVGQRASEAENIKR